MDHSIEKTELRELTDLEIDNVNGGSLALIVGVAVFVFAAGFVSGYQVGSGKGAIP